jgi:predicted CoA-substrate-specific enzyme activase
MTVTVAGIDIGSRAATAVLLKDGQLASSTIGDTLPDSVMTSNVTMSNLLNGTGLSIDKIDYIVATGYGRVLVPFAKENVSEISCHARGVNWYFPSVRTVLDMGGQDCKAISVDGQGRVTKFVMNDKCAGGTGRFLEMIAEVLGVPLAESGGLALQSKNSIPFNTICAVFAKTEAMAYRKKGADKGDILAGLNDAIAQRSLNLLKRVGIQKDFSITGGISKNKGLVAKLTEKVGMEPQLCPDPQLAGALGAALYAEERLKGVSSGSVEIQYGYSDGTGDYFITVDTAKCDACGLCVDACQEHILAMVREDGRGPYAAVKDELRKKLAYVCPGIKACGAKDKNCQKSCSKNAIKHSW